MEYTCYVTASFPWMQRRCQLDLKTATSSVRSDKPGALKDSVALRMRHKS